MDKLFRTPDISLLKSPRPTHIDRMGLHLTSPMMNTNIISNQLSELKKMMNGQEQSHHQTLPFLNTPINAMKISEKENTVPNSAFILKPTPRLATPLTLSLLSQPTNENPSVSVPKITKESNNHHPGPTSSSFQASHISTPEIGNDMDSLEVSKSSVRTKQSDSYFEEMTSSEVDENLITNRKPMNDELAKRIKIFLQKDLEAPSSGSIKKRNTVDIIVSTSPLIDHISSPNIITLQDQNISSPYTALRKSTRKSPSLNSHSSRSPLISNVSLLDKNEKVENQGKGNEIFLKENKPTTDNRNETKNDSDPRLVVTPSDKKEGGSKEPDSTHRRKRSLSENLLKGSSFSKSESIQVVSTTKRPMKPKDSRDNSAREALHEAGTKTALIPTVLMTDQTSFNPIVNPELKTDTDEKEKINPNVILKKWKMNRVPNDFEVTRHSLTEFPLWIILEGHKLLQDGTTQLWHSSLIVGLKSSRDLVTSTGKIYHIEGEIDSEGMVDSGLPESLVNHFKDGFPNNWIQIMAPYLQIDRKRHSKTTAKVVETKDPSSLTTQLSPVIKTPSRRGRPLKKSLSELDQRLVKKDLEADDKDKSRLNIAENGVVSKPSENASIDNNLNEEKTNSIIILKSHNRTPITDNNGSIRVTPKSSQYRAKRKRSFTKNKEVVGVLDRKYNHTPTSESKIVSTSRSGRKIVPPVAFWLNEYKVKGEDGQYNIVKGHDYLEFFRRLKPED